MMNYSYPLAHAVHHQQPLYHSQATNNHQLLTARDFSATSNVQVVPNISAAMYPQSNSLMKTTPQGIPVSALPPSKQRKPTEIFIGDLSYFCTETHLFELFSQYGNVQSVRIVRSQKKTRSLNFGFVCLETVHQAQEVSKLLNNHLFMGRNIKVEMSDYKSSPTASANTGFQVHVSFWGTFQPPATSPTVLPTEVFLRKYFIKYGTIIDAAVREYTINPAGKHYGYGFVAFEQEQSANAVLQDFASQEVAVHGITIKCTPSYRSTSASGPNGQPTSESVRAWMEMSSSSSFDSVSPRSAQSNALSMTHTYGYPGLVHSSQPSVTSSTDTETPRSYEGLNSSASSMKMAAYNGPYVSSDGGETVRQHLLRQPPTPSLNSSNNNHFQFDQFSKSYYPSSASSSSSMDGHDLQQLPGIPLSFLSTSNPYSSITTGGYANESATPLNNLKSSSSHF